MKEKYERGVFGSTLNDSITASKVNTMDVNWDKAMLCI